MSDLSATPEDINDAGLAAFLTAVERSPSLRAKVDPEALLLEVDRMYDEFNQLATLEDFMEFMQAWHERVIASHHDYRLSHWDSALCSHSNSFDASAAYTYLFNRAIRTSIKRVKVNRPAEVAATAKRDATIISMLSQVRKVIQRNAGRTILLSRTANACLDALIAVGLTKHLPHSPGRSGKSAAYYAEFNRVKRHSADLLVEFLNLCRTQYDCIPAVDYNQALNLVQLHARYHMRKAHHAVQPA